MIKIDTALNEKARKSSFIDATLSKDGWIGDAAPYTQALSVSGLSASSNGSINITNGATELERAAARSAMLSIARQSDGQLTIVADGDKPGIDLPVTVIIVD